MPREPELLGAPPLTGDKVGPYVLGETLGVGGMATVFQATGPDGEVAVKILHPGKIGTDEVKRFTREYEALRRMEHDNIVRVFEAGVHKGFPWLAMELIVGSDLESLIGRWNEHRPPDRFDQVEQVLRGLCAGLQYVHEMGLIHRDLKPSNVLVREDGVAKLTDFGVVKNPAGPNTALTMAGRLVGTVAFMSPEQINGEPLDARADLYGLGAVLYMMLTGRRPIEADSISGYLSRHLTEVPKAPYELDPLVPPLLDQICQRLLMKDPARRFPTAAGVLRALDNQDANERPPLRGRGEQEDWWATRVDALKNGAGGCVVVEASAGMGKSHLLLELLDQAATQGVSTAYVSAGQQGNLVEALLDQLPLSGLTEVGQTGVDRLRARLGQRPWVLAVDDLDRAHADALEPLVRVARTNVAIEGSPWLLLLAGEDLQGPARSLANGISTGLPEERLDLGPLDARWTVALLRDRGVTGSAAAVLGRRLHQSLGGQPGPVLEQLRTLQESGWLVRDTDGRLVANRHITDLRNRPLPVPARVKVQIESQLSTISGEAQELLLLLAVLGRPTSASLLAAAASDPLAAGRALDQLVARSFLERDEVGGDEELRFVQAGTGSVVLSKASEATRQRAHARIARALLRRHRRRRGAMAAQIAHHLLHAGETAKAYPLLLQAARHAARSEKHGQVLELGRKALEIQEAAEAELSSEEQVRTRRWLHQLIGEAWMARGEWKDAVDHLTRAASFADDDLDAQLRCLTCLGRSQYRLGEHAQARETLGTCLELSEPGHPDRIRAARTLADLAMRAGDLDQAETLLDEVRQSAVVARDREAEARALRGLAHVNVYRQRYPAARDQLDRAEDLLGLTGDPRVRASVLARGLELDIASGRLHSALRRATTLVTFCEDADLGTRLPEAFALSAEAELAAGLFDKALQSARSTLTYARAQPSRHWDAMLRACSVLCGLAHEDEAEDALPAQAMVEDSGVLDGPTRRAAVEALCLAPHKPQRARDLARWALTRTHTSLPLHAAWIELTCARALRETGEREASRSAAKKGLARLTGPGIDGLRVELLLAMHKASPDRRVLATAGELVHRMVQGLPRPVAQGYTSRTEISLALQALQA